jgi:hypothetical protein
MSNKSYFVEHKAVDITICNALVKVLEDIIAAKFFVGYVNKSKSNFAVRGVFLMLIDRFT